MAFWPDKPQLLIVLDDTTIKILNWLTGRQLNALTVPDGFLNTMAPLPDGYQLLLA